MTDYTHIATRSARSIYALLDDDTREELRRIVRKEDEDAYQLELQAASRRRAARNAN
ncbi:MAG: hypothetical protein M3R04_05910 [bacterium]|nr:hypothetical protein [bacterium]